jgi:uncharacterized protein
MRIELTKHPSSPTIIVGFPGVGLIGPIVTEFLINHLKTEVIGNFVYEELPPLVPIHKGILVHPMSIHYSAKYNTVIVYTILNLKKQEWKVAGAIAQLAKDLSAKELICLDGATTVGSDEMVYSYGNPQFVTLGAKAMEESVILGANAALLLSSPHTSCIFAAAHLDMPDSKAAAEVVKFLDKYLGLDVDYQPLVEQAQKFEEKLKSVMNKQSLTEEEKKSLDYFG